MGNYTTVMLPSEEAGLKRFAAIDSQKRIVGRLDIRLEDGIVTMPYIFVEEGERRKKIASDLLQDVLSALDEKDLFMPFEIRFAEEKESEALLSFLKAQGNFIIEESAYVFTASASQRRKISKWKEMSMKETDAVELFSLDKIRLSNFEKDLRKRGFDDFADLEAGNYDKRLSFARIKDDHISGAILVSVFEEKDVEASFLFVGDKNVKTLRSLLCAAINAVDELYPKADIRFTAINPASYGLAQGIFGDEIKPLPLICARWNGLSADVLNGIDGLEELDEEEEA